MEDLTAHPVQHKRSLWRGALIAPWVVPLAVGLILGIGGTIGYLIGPADQPEPMPGTMIGLIILIIIFGVPFTYLVTFLCVVPVALLLRKWQALSAARLCIWCALIAPATMWAYATMLKGQPEKVLTPGGLAMGASFGLVSGIAFCVASRVRLFAGRRKH